MNIHHASSQWAAALQQFERQFRYPLGKQGSFRISHGEDYTRFFRAMGEATTLLAERHGTILGVASAALRPLHMPDGSLATVAYIGDVKVEPLARGGRTLWRLMEALKAWIGTRATHALAVVMEGTPVDPRRYTGRVGIPPFAPVAPLAVLELREPISFPNESQYREVASEHGIACFRNLVGDACWCADGDPSLRSATTPLWLVESGGRACGRLEDTRQAKRLWDDQGQEIRHAHLSHFAWADHESGVRLLSVVLEHALEKGFDGLFTTTSREAGVAFAARQHAFKIAPAMVYGAGATAAAAPNGRWMINSAEI